MKSHLLLLPVIGLVLLISENVECVRFKMAVSSALDEQVQGLCFEVCAMTITSNGSSVEHSRCPSHCPAMITERLRTMCLVCKLKSRNNGQCDYSGDCEDSPGIFQLTNQSATVAANLTICHLVLLILAISQILRASMLE